MELAHDLPAGMTDWIEGVGDGRITRLERHVARREAWVVDVTRSDGSVLEGFLRLEREPQPGNPWSLEKEARIVDALGATSVPVPALHGWNADLTCALFARDPGRADLDKVTDLAAQRAVMEDFMRVVGRMHNLDLDALGLDDVMASRPRTPRDCALGELDLILDQWKAFLSAYTDPLLTFGVEWLRRSVPASVARVSLVQGDTGPVNFLFRDDKVSAVIDWEWGHFGDPMEDLGNICVREFWNPSGGLKGLFELYAESSGIPYSRAAVLYYRVQQNVRGMIPIHFVTVNAHPRESIAWYLAYRYVGDRATCEAIAEAMGIELDRPEMPDGDGEGDGAGAGVDILADAAQYALEHDVLPEVNGAFARSRLDDVNVLVQCMDRRRRFGATIEKIECDEIGALLGRRPRSLAAGVRAVDAAIRRGRVDDSAVLRYLARRAYRDEWLHSPAVSLYPARSWSPID
jgi:aminoglycoside phosphotransferase (APT) family kinase protein